MSRGVSQLIDTVIHNSMPKAELSKVGIFFALNFLPWEFLLIKKLEIEKTQYTPSMQLLKLI